MRVAITHRLADLGDIDVCVQCVSNKLRSLHYAKIYIVDRMASLGGFPVGVECLALTQNVVFCAIVHILSPIKIKGQDMNFGRMSL